MRKLYSNILLISIFLPALFMANKQVEKVSDKMMMTKLEANPEHLAQNRVERSVYRDKTTQLEATATTNAFTSSPTDYYRSAQTGNWDAASTWESSSDNINWVPATLTPTSTADTITIQTGHTVTVVASTTADQLIIDDLAILEHVSGTFTIEDGIGRDVLIKVGGVLLLSTDGISPSFGSGNPVIYNSGGGIIRVSATGLTDAGTGVNANNYVYGHLSILEFTVSGTFAASGVVFFPNVAIDTVPIFRTTNTGNILFGSNNFTTINGYFECTGADISWQGTGVKTFRNGIIGPGNVIALASSGKFIINGKTAQLGEIPGFLGVGSLIVPAAGLEIGSASNATAVYLTAAVTITGNISLLSVNNTIIDLLYHNLIVTGNITGGTANAYVRISSGGFLTLTGVTTSRVFPIGSYSGYNPLVISNGGGADISAKVTLGINNPPVSFPTYGINKTWYIGASVVSNNVTVSFQYTGLDLGVNIIPSDQVEILQSDYTAWSIIAGNTGINQAGSDPYTVTTTTPLTINNSFIPYAIGKSGGLILPIDCGVSCRSKKINNSGFISWEINNCAGVNSYEVQRSVNGGAYQTIGTVTTGTQINYNYTDASLAGGTNLYRIKVNRSSGAIKYSNTVAIINDTKGILITALSPNPVEYNAKLIINGAKAGAVNFTIFDVMGRPVRQWQSVITEGSNTINVNAIGLAAGIYHLSATNGDSKTVIRFVKE